MEYIYIVLAILNLVILPISIYYKLDYLKTTIVILDILIFIYSFTITKENRNSYSLEEVRYKVEEIIGKQNK